MVSLLCGCISPYAKIDQPDLKWYAEDRYRFADAMPATNKDEAFHKIEAYWETIEAVRHIKDKDTVLTMGGEKMNRDAARDHVNGRIRSTEQAVGITAGDYCGRAAVWTGMIPVKIVMSPFDAACILVESPVSNIEW
jgi:hypothetical protein